MLGVFWLLREKNRPWLVGWVVHVLLLILLDFFRQYGEEKKNRQSREPMLHTVHTVLHIMYSFQFCVILSETPRQAGSHLKLIFVKDFFCFHASLR